MKRKLFACFGIIVIAGGIWFYRWSNSPANAGTIITPQGNSVFGAQVSLKPYTTQYFSTRIPTTLQIKSSNETMNGVTLGQYLFKHSNTSLADQLGITVGKMQSNSLSEIAAVKLRQSQPNIYKPIEEISTPLGGIAFESVDAYEVSVFWPEKGRYAAVVVSGSSVRKAELNDALRSIVANWQWQ